MAAARDLALRLLISAKDTASGVIGKIGGAFGSLGRGAARVMGDIRTEATAAI